MSILFKGVEMPKGCWDCPFQTNPICITNDILNFTTRIARPDNCPLIEVPIDYDKLLKVAKAMHTWIFLHSGNEELAYKACGLSDEMNAVLGYAGSFTVIPADKDGET